MRVVAYVQEPLSNAGSRCRIDALRPGLAERGISLRVFPPMGDSLAAWCKRGGALRRMLYYVIFLAGRLRDLRHAAGADAVIVFRAMFPVGPPWLERIARFLNTNLIFDFDDAVHLRPPFATQGYRWVNLDSPIRTLRMARAAVVGSPWLEEFALRHCARVVVIPSCLDTARYSPRTESAGKPLVIGWIGSRSGFTYLHALDDVWRELHRRHGTLFRVVSNGEYRADGFEIENVAWSLEGEVAALQSFDIGVMPLSDTPFERGKAGFKLLQCMAVGVPAVASPIGVNQEIAGNEQSGAQLRALLASTSEGWTAALERLIADPALRRRMGEAGRAHVLKHYDIGCAVNAWDALLREVAGK